MLHIRDKDGMVVSSSSNLRGIRREVGKSLVKWVDICRVGEGEGQLSILFDNGNSFQCNFASYRVLAGTVRRWRNLYGCQLSIGGLTAGDVHMYNDYLEKEETGV